MESIIEAKMLEWPALVLNFLPYTSELLGEQPAPKTGGRGSTPRARAWCRRGSTECLHLALRICRASWPTPPFLSDVETHS